MLFPATLLCTRMSFLDSPVINKRVPQRFWQDQKFYSPSIQYHWWKPAIKSMSYWFYCTCFFDKIKSLLYSISLMKTCYKEYVLLVLLHLTLPGQRLDFLFSGASFHIPLTKTATLNRILHCSLLQFSGALFRFSRALFCISGAKSPGAPVYFPPWLL